MVTSIAIGKIACQRRHLIIKKWRNKIHFWSDYLLCNKEPNLYIISHSAQLAQRFVAPSGECHWNKSLVLHVVVKQR